MDVLAELRESVPETSVLTDPDVIAGYRFDFSRDPSAGTPMAVVRVEDAEPGPGYRLGGPLRMACPWCRAARGAGCRVARAPSTAASSSASSG